MGQNNQIKKTAAMFLSVFLMAVTIDSTVVSSVYAMHKHEYHEEEYCVICLVMYAAENGTRHLTLAGSQNIGHVFFTVFVSVLCIGWISHIVEHNLITDKVRMDR